jgi:hypothetical protein
MATTSGDQAGIDAKFGRAPIDRLFLGCVLAAVLGYGVFLIVLQLMPRAPEGDARQGYVGMVDNQSQPGGLGGEQDPATGTAQAGGAQVGYYIGNGAAPRPVELVEGSAERVETQGEAARRRAPVVIPATRVEPGTVPGFGSGSSLGKLAVDSLVRERVAELSAAIEREPDDVTASRR